MLGLPKTTKFNKQFPKQKFYGKLNVTPTLKRVFIDQIKVIYWRNKIATTTVNLAAGETVTEIEVFEIKLSAPQLDVAVLKQIDKEIRITFFFCWNMKGSIRRGQHTKRLQSPAQMLLRLAPTTTRTGCRKASCR